MRSNWQRRGFLSNTEHCIQADFLSEAPSPPDLSSVFQNILFIELAVDVWEMVWVTERNVGRACG